MQPRADAAWHEPGPDGRVRRADDDDGDRFGGCEIVEPVVRRARRHGAGSDAVGLDAAELAAQTPSDLLSLLLGV